MMLIRVFLLAAVLVICFPAGEAGASLRIDEIHGALDEGVIGPLQAARRYAVAARALRGRPEEAAEALFSAGVVYERLERFYDASELYLAVVSDYPGTIWRMPAVDALMVTGEEVFSAAKRGASREMRLARRIYSELAEIDFPAEVRAFLVYRKGLAALKSRAEVEAESDFERVLEEYPEEPWKEKAFFGLGKIYAGRVRRPSRDQSPTVLAISHLESFIDRYPESGFRMEAEEHLEALRERKAEYLFNICKFYRRSGETEAFELYYGILTENYPGTSWAERAYEDFRK